MIITDQKSPNFDDRPDGVKPDMVVLHYTGMAKAEEARARLTDEKSKVSSHYLIDESGKTYLLVDEEKRAWHAGFSYWQGRENINHYSIGIELQNAGHEYGYTQFPETQIESLLTLLEGIFSRHNIKPENVVGHSDIAPSRKEDPGEYFPWKLLAERGFSIWPKKNYSVKSGGRVIARMGDKAGYIGSVQKKLSDFGYKIEVTDEFDLQTAIVVTAFRRRFIPAFIAPLWDELAEIYLSDLMGQLTRG